MVRATTNFSSLKATTVVLCLLVCLLAAGWVWADPSVTNVIGSQRADGTGMVDVYYNLANGASTMSVSLYFSNNNGASWNIIPSQTLLTGDFGLGITNGAGKHIAWNAARNYPEVNWPQMKARVTAAETGQTMTILLPGDVPLEMVLIPAGTFMMGSGDDPGWSQSNETPQHLVTISQPFWMGKYPVTQAQWWAIEGNNPSMFQSSQNNPVEQISWNDCQDFITKMNARGAGTFALPSEAQWEYACRAGSTTRWYYGDDSSLLTNYAWFSDNSGGQTHVVGQKLANMFGLYDMAGNVWEWCQDSWHGDYTGAPTDGSAWQDATPQYRVLRGGAYDSTSSCCRSASRNYYYFPDLRFNLYGVRLVRTQ